MTGRAEMRVSARSLGGDAWEVSLPKRKSAVRGKGGIRPRRTVHAPDEAAAVSLGEELFEREYAFYKMGVTMNLADLALFYLDHAEADGSYSAATARDYRNQVARYVAPEFTLDADEATAFDIERLYAHLMESGGRGGAGVSPNTVHKLNTVLRATYEFITREDPSISNPMPAINPPKRVRQVKRSLTDRESAKFLDGLEAELSLAPADAAGIKRRNALFGAYLAYYTGARVGEICAITRGDVRALDESVRIEHSMSEKGGLHMKGPKTESGRRQVAIDHGAFEQLRLHFGWQASYLTRAQRDDDSTPVCCIADGGFMRPREMSASFKAFCAEVGVELGDGESFHILRHTHATYLLSNGFNPELVRKRLGHSRIETTLGYYGHTVSGEDAAAARGFGEIVSRARKAGELR